VALARATVRERDWRQSRTALPDAVALTGHEQPMAGAIAASDAGDARAAGEGSRLPALAVGERSVDGPRAASATGAEEHRPRVWRELEAMPVAGLAAVLEFHGVIGMVERARQHAREAVGGERLRVVVALDVPRWRAEPGQDTGRGRGRDAERERGADEEREFHRDCLLV